MQILHQRAELLPPSIRLLRAVQFLAIVTCFS